MMTMVGLDSYTATKESFVGIDWLNLTSGALKTGAGAVSAFSSPDAGSQPTAQAAAEKARLEEQRKTAEASAATWRKVGIAGVLALVLGGGWYWLKHRKAA